MSSETAADQGGGSATAGDEVEAVEAPVDAAVLDPKAEKIHRVKTELKRSKPAKGSHPVWKYYKVYVSARFADKAICQLCVDNGKFGTAEIKFPGGSPTNLLSHLDTSYQGHRDAYNDAMASLAKPAPGEGAGSAAAAAGGTIRSFFKQEEVHWNEDLIRLIVNNYLSLSVSCFVFVLL